jgi:uncharacterized protein (DUF111 family)
MGAGLEPAVESDALRVLERRERAEAMYLGVALEQRVYRGDDVADTLIDVVGGLLLWDALGRPAVQTWGPVAVGGRVRSSSVSLLGAVPTVEGHAGFELVTPTGAALLGATWSGVCADEPPWQFEVHGDFSRAAGLPPVRAALV